MVKRKTQATRMARKLTELRAQLRRRWHAKVSEQHAWLSQVLRGHYRYYGLIFNGRSLNQFYQLVKRMWFNALQRRSQKSRINWTQFDRLQSNRHPGVRAEHRVRPPRRRMHELRQPGKARADAPARPVTGVSPACNPMAGR
jgi:hypothetical protein